MNKWFLSSTGSQDLSLTIKGLLTSIIPLALITIRYYNINLDENDLIQIVQGITSVISVGVIILGLVRKALNKF